jgi:hypothetical protein
MPGIARGQIYDVARPARLILMAALAKGSSATIALPAVIFVWSAFEKEFGAEFEIARQTFSIGAKNSICDSLNRYAPNFRD